MQFLGGSTVRGPHLSLPAFREIAATLFPHVVRWQPSVSGEPLLTRDFATMVGIGLEHGVQLDLTTNGTRWTDALLDVVARAAHLVQISFDSPVPERFEAIRRGARFDVVVAGIQALRARSRQVRPDAMPRIGLSVTLMRDNVDDLADLVEFGATVLGIDHLQVLHVYPVDDCVRLQSLVHDLERAVRGIAAAAERARSFGVGLFVHPLDEPTALAARPQAPVRSVGCGGGAVLEGVVVDARPTPSRLPDARGRDRAMLAATPDPALPRRIGFCDFLWDRLYVGIGGEILPCCVAGAPVIGSVWDHDFDAIWNGGLYRELRQRIVAREPAPVCRGCRAYREIDDPARIAQVLGDTQPVAAGRLGGCSDALDPGRMAPTPRRTGPPPRLVWGVIADPENVELQVSTDRFVTQIFRSSTFGIRVEPSGWTIPEAMWAQAPRDQSLFWRLVDTRAAHAPPIASGRVLPQGPG
jgi:MoaA/NifB/PqqE/SkfB family radical SAM enzyme